VREYLADMAEISRVAAEPDDEEADEDAYTELVEYIRVGVLLCREHMGHPVQPPEEVIAKKLYSQTPACRGRS